MNNDCITYDEVETLLHLNTEDKALNEMIFNATVTELENYLGYKITEENHNEKFIVIDNQILLDELNLKEVISITDTHKGENITICKVDYPNKTINFSNNTYNQEKVFVNYNTGYTKETLPADIKECILKLFLRKQKAFINEMNYTESLELIISDDIQKCIDIYRRKRI